MGSGASQPDLRNALTETSDQDLRTWLSNLGHESRTKIQQTLIACEQKIAVCNPFSLEYEVHVNGTTGKPLGVLAEMSGGVFVVSAIGVGLISEWNQEHHEQVSPGDQIVQVNGVRDYHEMLGLWSQDIRLIIRFRRELRKNSPGADAINPSTYYPTIESPPSSFALLEAHSKPQQPEGYHDDPLYKLLLVGEACTGKTHLLSRYIRGTLPKNPTATIGVEFATRTIELETGDVVKAQIWDTAGQERYRAITSAHYRCTVGAFLVYDVTQHSTFLCCQQFMEQLRQEAEPGLVMMLVGNKVDLVEKTPSARQVTSATAAEFARHNDLLFCEASAVTACNVTNLFEDLLQEICNRLRGPCRVLQLELAYGPDKHGMAKLQCMDMGGSSVFSTSCNLTSTLTAELFQQVSKSLGLSACGFRLLCNGVTLGRRHKGMPLADLFEAEATPGQKEQLASSNPPIDGNVPASKQPQAVTAAVGATAGQTGGEADGYKYKGFPDGSRYEGQWKDGLKHGKGRFIYPDGDVYDGEWQDGKAHGHGTYTSRQSKYLGEWQNDLKHGQAVEEWDDTSKYTGTYSHGQKHGKGRFEWPDGSVYDGEFRNNNVEGEGTFMWKDGRQYKGQWVDNRMHGEGRYEWPDGRAYEGQYINDLKEGEGTFLWADGRKFTGQWKDGKQHGVGVFRTAHGDQRTGEWREGVRVCWVDEAPAD